MILDTASLSNVSFTGKRQLVLTCATCYSGKLIPVNKPLSEKTAYVKASEKQEYDNGFEHEARTFYFLKCNNAKCGEPYFVVGNEYQGFEPIYDKHNNQIDDVEVIAFRPIFFNPPIHFFKLSEFLPKSISNEMVKSFGVFFYDAASAANKVRIALEMLMNELNVPKNRISKKGKEVDLDLHGRIEEYEKINPEIGEQLLSIKLVGNLGSHLTGVDRNDVIVAYEIIEHVFDELFVRERRKSEFRIKAMKLKSKGSQSKN